jgi:hypothetical protein
LKVYQGHRKVIELPASPFALSLWMGRRQWFDKFTTNGICARHGPCNSPDSTMPRYGHMGVL